MTDPNKLTIEPHGNGHAVYSGREQGDYDPGDGSFYSGSHGNRLFNVTDATEAGLQVAHEMVAAVNAVPELLAIKQAVSDYHFALDSREHGGVAANRLVDAVQSALGQHWVCGAEAERRAALNQEPGQ